MVLGDRRSGRRRFPIPQKETREATAGPDLICVDAKLLRNLCCFHKGASQLAGAGEPWNAAPDFRSRHNVAPPDAIGLGGRFHTAIPLHPIVAVIRVRVAPRWIVADRRWSRDRRRHGLYRRRSQRRSRWYRLRYRSFSVRCSRRRAAARSELLACLWPNRAYLPGGLPPLACGGQKPTRCRHRLCVPLFLRP